MDEDLPPLPDDAADFVSEVIEEQHGYLSWLGTRVETVERGRMVLSVPFDEKLTNPTTERTVHGGVAATLADTAGGLAQRTAVPEPLSTRVATVTLNLNYLQEATGDIRATAEVIRCGSTIGVSDVTVTSTTADDEEERVATGQPSYRIFR